MSRLVGGVMQICWPSGIQLVVNFFGFNCKCSSSNCNCNCECNSNRWQLSPIKRAVSLASHRLVSFSFACSCALSLKFDNAPSHKHNGIIRIVPNNLQLATGNLSCQLAAAQLNCRSFIELSSGSYIVSVYMAKSSARLSANYRPDFVDFAGFAVIVWRLQRSFCFFLFFASLFVLLYQQLRMGEPVAWADSFPFGFYVACN